MPTDEAERSPGAMFVEAHEEFVQHIEEGQRRIRALSVVTVVVAALLSASYLVQIAYPIALGQSVVTVNLNDPTLVTVEIVVLLLAVSWVAIGLANYRFATRLGRTIAGARAAEKDLERKLVTS